MSNHEIDYSGKYNVVSQGGFAEFLSAVGVGAMIQAMAVAMGKGALRSLTIEHEGDLFRTRTVTPLREMVANFRFDTMHEHDTPVCQAKSVTRWLGKETKVEISKDEVEAGEPVVEDYGEYTDFASIVQETDFVGRAGGSVTTRTLYLTKDPETPDIMTVRIEILDKEGKKTGVQLCRVMERVEDHSKKRLASATDAADAAVAPAGNGAAADAVPEPETAGGAPAEPQKDEENNKPESSTGATEAKTDETAPEPSLPAPSAGKSAAADAAADASHNETTIKAAGAEATGSSSAKRKGPDSGFETEGAGPDGEGVKKAKVD